MAVRSSSERRVLEIPDATRGSSGSVGDTKATLSYQPSERVGDLVVHTMRKVGIPLVVTLISNRHGCQGLSLWEVVSFSLHMYSLIQMCACRGLDTERNGVLFESGLRRRYGLFTLYCCMSFDAIFCQHGPQFSYFIIEAECFLSKLCLIGAQLNNFYLQRFDVGFLALPVGPTWQPSLG
jgi:hypothetical protein